MTISSTNRKAGPYSGNDSTTIFPFVFKVFSTEEVLVVRADATGAESVLVLDSGYTVLLNADQDANPGGSVTLPAALATGDTLTISSALENLQPTELTSQGGFYPRVITNALDRLTILVQQIAEAVSRSLKMAISTPDGVDPQLPAPAPYAVIGWNGEGDGFANYDPSGESSIAADLASPGKGASLIAFAINQAYPSGTVGAAIKERGVSVKDFPFLAYGNGEKDDTAAIQAALDSDAAHIIIPDGFTFVIKNPGGSSSTTPVLTSAVANRVISGGGIITANEQVKVALRVTGENTTVSLHIDGNLNIGYAIECTADRPTVTGCYIHDLDGKTDWGGVAVRLNFGANDYSGTVSHNRIENLQGAGDGNVGNGTGMQRAVLVQTNVNCTKRTFITGNMINGVYGEEGDSIVIQGGGTEDTKYVPAVVSNNVINGWYRRAVKIAANGVSVVGNHFENDLAADPGSMQRVVDATSASDFAVIGNVFNKCKYQPQIAVVLGADQSGSNINVANNIISGVGSTVANSLIAITTYGSKVVVANNVIDCPDHATRAVDVFQTAGVVVSGNAVNIGVTGWNLFTNSTAVKLFGNVISKEGKYQQYIDPVNDEHVFDVTAGAKRVTLKNTNAFVTDGLIVAKLSCRQNDASNPDNLIASVGFVGEGTSGKLGVGIFTGDGTNPDVEKLRISNSGTVRPTTDNAQPLGAAANRWSVVYAGTGTINTSDEREKQDIRSMIDAERAVALKIKGAIKAFRFRDSVENKGDSARIHFGVIAQEVKAAFESEGLDPFAYALLCYDEWPEQLEVKDEEGRIVQAYRPAGNRYGIRYDELLAFIIGVL